MAISFEQPWNHSDQILAVEERQFHVHRCVLSLWSPVFDRMFNSGFKESGCDHVTLHDKKSAEIQEMLEVIYDRRKEVNSENICFLLELAEEYQMDQLRNECVKYINSANKSGINAMKYYQLAERFGIDDAKEKCKKELARVPHEILRTTEAYEQADDTVKSLILQARVESLEKLMAQLKPALNTLLHYIYHCAHNEFEQFLRDKALDGTTLNKCMDSESHTRNKKHSFDVACKMCRQKTIRATKHVTLNTKETDDVLERLYTLTNEMEEMSIDDKNC